MSFSTLRFRSSITSSISMLFATAVLALPFAARAADDVHFMLDWIPSGEMAAYYAGWQNGVWADEGINIRISRGYGSGDTVSKLAGGAADFGIADIGAVLTARARAGIPVKTISIAYTHSPHSLFVLESSGISDFKGLEGKQIGVTPGNSHKLYFPKVAERAGTDPTKVTWVNTDASAMAALLIAKNIDAAPFYSIHHYYQNKAAEKEGEKIIALPFEKTGFAIYSASIISTDEKIKENPDLTRRFLRGLQRSYLWAKDNQTEACELHVKKNPEVALDDCQGSLKAMLGFVFNDHSASTGLGLEDPERLAFTWKVIAEAQDLDEKWGYQEAVDTSFVPRTQ